MITNDVIVIFTEIDNPFLYNIYIIMLYITHNTPPNMLWIIYYIFKNIMEIKEENSISLNVENNTINCSIYLYILKIIIICLFFLVIISLIYIYLIKNSNNFI